MLQVTGGWALHPCLLALPFTGVPRADIAVTVWGLPEYARTPLLVGELSRAAAANCGRRPWDVTLWDGEKRGHTSYLGSKNSDTYVRVYDKGAQSSEPGYAGAVRYEVQSRNKFAAANLRYIAGRTDPAAAAIDIVQREMGNKGVRLPDAISVLAAEAPPNPRETPGDTDTTLKWLADGVAPTLARLEASGVSYELLHRLLFRRRHDVELDSFGERVIK
jgi:hypothetical protein